MTLLDLMVKIGCDDEASKEVEALGSRLANGLSGKAAVAAGAIAAFSAAAVAGFVAIEKKSLEAFASYEQLTGGVETLFKNSAGVVEQYAQQAYQSAGMSANEYMETITGFSASLLQSLGNDTAKAAEYGNQAVVDMSDNANKMGTSMSSIQYAYQGFAKQNYTMLDNLKLGYGGTKSEMERLISDANRVKEANGEMADLSIDSFADVVEAIHIIQTEMGITGTTAEEAATTIEGSVNSMKGAWENWLTALAAPELDVGVATEQLVSSFETVVSNVIPRVQEIAGSLGEVILIGIQSTMTPEQFSFIQPIFDGLGSAISGVVSAFSSLGEAFSNLFAALQPVMPFIAYIAGLLGTVLVGAIAGVVSAIAGVVDTVSTAVTTVISFVSNLVPNIQATFSSIVAAAASWASSMGAKASAAASSIVSNITSGLASLPSKMVSVGSNIIQGLIDGAKSMASSLVSSVTGVVDDAIAAAKELLGIHSPSRVFKQIGHYTMEGMAIGIDDGSMQAIDSMDKAISGIEGSAVVSTTVNQNNAGNNILSEVAILLTKILEEMPDSIDLDGREFGRFVRGYA